MVQAARWVGLRFWWFYEGEKKGRGYAFIQANTGRCRSSGQQSTIQGGLGGKSRKVSEAIVAYFGTSKHGGMPSYEELVQNVAALQNIILKNSENDPPSRGYLTRIIAKIRRLVPFL